MIPLQTKLIFPSVHWLRRYGGTCMYSTLSWSNRTSQPTSYIYGHKYVNKHDPGVSRKNVDTEWMSINEQIIFIYIICWKPPKLPNFTLFYASQNSVYESHFTNIDSVFAFVDILRWDVWTQSERFCLHFNLIILAI